MIAGIWGRKIGMTQIFSSNKVVPVTVIDVADWLVTDIKTEGRDGYFALQVGQRKAKYRNSEFSQDWLADKKKYFSATREIKLDKASDEIIIGKSIDIADVLSSGASVDVVGLTKGAGFAGVVKRHGFGGGRATHGGTVLRAPGSISSYRSQGRVIKNKKMAGHMGCEQKTVAHLSVVAVEPKNQTILLSGSIPGKPGSLVYIKKSKA